MSSKEVALTPENISLVMGDTAPEVVKQEDAARNIVEKILAADDLQGIFAEDSTVNSQAMVGIGLTITDVRIMASELEDSAKSYMLVDAEVIDSHEKVTINTGSRNIMAKLFNLKLRGFLPVEAVIVELGAARKGESAPLGLKAVGKTLAAVEGK